MTKEQWSEMKYFHPGENWGDPNLMSFTLLFWLDRLRHVVGKPFVITSGTGGKHAASSYHYKGEAVDLVIPSLGKENLLDVFWTALNLPFNGIGLYPDWQCHGEVVGGLHLDIRKEPKLVWLKTKKGHYDFNVTIKKLVKHFGVGNQATSVYLSNSPHYTPIKPAKLRDGEVGVPPVRAGDFPLGFFK